MGTYVMSDIHGRWDAYDSMLRKLGFNSFNCKDKIYILGDVIDRGPDGIKILKHIINNQKHIEMLVGNHELLMIEALETSNYNLWFYNGGISTIIEYQKLDSNEQLEIVNYIKSLDYNKEVELNGRIYYLVHGRPEGMTNKFCGIDPSWLYGMSNREQMVWGQMNKTMRLSNKTVIFGHRCTNHYQDITPYRIYKEEGMIGIDCGCAYEDGNGRLGCLELEGMEEFYTEFEITL